MLNPAREPRAIPETDSARHLHDRKLGPTVCKRRLYGLGAATRIASRANRRRLQFALGDDR
jgi:hypothetical protein